MDSHPLTCGIIETGMRPVGSEGWRSFEMIVVSSKTTSDQKVISGRSPSSNGPGCLHEAHHDTTAHLLLGSGPISLNSLGSRP